MGKFKLSGKSASAVTAMSQATLTNAVVTQSNGVTKMARTLLRCNHDDSHHGAEQPRRGSHELQSSWKCSAALSVLKESARRALQVYSKLLVESGELPVVTATDSTFVFAFCSGRAFD